MSFNMETKDNSLLLADEMKDIELLVDNLIEKHRTNQGQLNKFVIESVTAITASESKAKEIGSQGFLKRSWFNLTGKNTELRADIDRNIAIFQYASQQMIQKLAEQNLITFEMLTAINNRLSCMMVGVENEINKIYETLLNLFRYQKSLIVSIHNRLDNIEQNLQLLNWVNTIEHLCYEEKVFNSLSDTEKIVCIINDFYNITKGNWKFQDLIFLKTVYVNVGIDFNKQISISDFYKEISCRPDLIKKLFMNITTEKLSMFETFELPVLKGLEKIEKLYSEDKYIVNVITRKLDKEKTSYTISDIIAEISEEYVADNSHINTNYKVSILDFTYDILNSLFCVDKYESQEISEPFVQNEFNSMHESVALESLNVEEIYDKINIKWNFETDNYIYYLVLCSKK